MKKIILMVLAIATFNANAAIIEISTDKSIYQVGETITATVSFSNEDAFLVSYRFLNRLMYITRQLVLTIRS